MPRRKRTDTEKAEALEYLRLKEQYAGLPPKKAAVADGLMHQAARLRCYLDTLWLDIQMNGTTELFTQSEKTEPYERERPSARLFISADKNYQSVMKQLNDMLPTEAAPVAADPLASLMSELHDDG